MGLGGSLSGFGGKDYKNEFLVENIKYVTAVFGFFFLEV